MGKRCCIRRCYCSGLAYPLGPVHATMNSQLFNCFHRRRLFAICESFWLLLLFLFRFLLVCCSRLSGSWPGQQCINCAHQRPRKWRHSAFGQTKKPEKWIKRAASKMQICRFNGKCHSLRISPSAVRSALTY